MDCDEFGRRLARQRIRVRAWSQPALGRNMAIESARLGRPLAPVPKATISAWENGHRFPEPWYAYVLCGTLGVTSDALGLGDVLTPAVVGELEAAAERGRSDGHGHAPGRNGGGDGVPLTGGTGAGLHGTQADWERVAFMLNSTRRLDAATVAQLRALTAGYLAARERTGPRVLLPALHAHIATLRTLLPLAGSRAQRRELVMMAGETACAAGDLWYMLYDYGEAQAAFRFARELGHELGETSIEAVALISQGLLYMNRLHGDEEGLPGGPAKSIQLHDAAESVAGAGARPELRLMLYSRRAWQHAGADDEAAAKRDLDTAQRAVAQLAPIADGGFFAPWGAGYLLVSRAKVAFLLGEAGDSVRLFEDALGDTSGYMRPFYEVQMAAACARAGELERAGSILNRTVDAALTRNAAMLIRRITKLTDEDLAPCRTHPAVRSVRDRLEVHAGAV